MSSLGLTSFPEELLERILAHCVVSPTSLAPRPSWHKQGGSSSTQAPVRGRIALLLVSKTFLRICTPLFYHTVCICSAQQLHRLLSNALRPNPILASYIRRLMFSGIWADGGELLHLCSTNLRVLDLTLDVTQLSPAVRAPIRDLDAEEFCKGLTEITSLTHIVIRKPGNVYLTQPKPRIVLVELAEAMQRWNELEHADIPFRLSDDSGHMQARITPGNGIEYLEGPIATLTRSLSTRPKLHTLSTLLPSVWNESILRVSRNPALERIILDDGVGGRDSSYSRGGPWLARDLYAAPVAATIPSSPALEGGHGIQSTGLFFLQAKKHPRLCELIRAGTYITRTRAQTMAMGNPASSPLPAFASSQSKTPSQTSQHLHRGQSPAYHPRSQGVSHSPVAQSSNHLSMSASFRTAPARNCSAAPRTWESSAFAGPSSSSSHRPTSSRPFAYTAASLSWR